MARSASYAVICCLLGGCSADRPGLVLSSGSDAQQTDGVVRLAADLEHNGQLKNALPLYESAAATGGEPAQLRLADAYLRANEVDKAIATYRAVLDKSPENTQAALGLGAAYLKNSDPDAAIAALAPAVARANTTTAYNRLAVAQTLAGRLDEAEQSLTTARSLAPDDLDIRSNLALVLALGGQDDKAVATMREITASPSCEPRQRRNSMIVFGLLGRADEGRAAMPAGMKRAEANELLKRAGAIRVMTDPRARAKALGVIAMS